MSASERLGSLSLSNSISLFCPMSKDCFSNIPTDTKNKISEFLTCDEVGNIIRTSKVMKKDFDNEKNWKFLLKRDYRFSPKPQDVTWKMHYEFCKSSFYDRVRDNYRKGFIFCYKHLPAFVNIISTAALTSAVTYSASSFGPGVVKNIGPALAVNQTACISCAALVAIGGVASASINGARILAYGFSPFCAAAACIVATGVAKNNAVVVGIAGGLISAAGAALSYIPANVVDICGIGSIAAGAALGIAETAGFINTAVSVISIVGLNRNITSAIGDGYAVTIGSYSAICLSAAIMASIPISSVLAGAIIGGVGAGGVYVLSDGISRLADLVTNSTSVRKIFGWIGGNASSLVTRIRG